MLFIYGRREFIVFMGASKSARICVSPQLERKKTAWSCTHRRCFSSFALFAFKSGAFLLIEMSVIFASDCEFVCILLIFEMNEHFTPVISTHLF